MAEYPGLSWDFTEGLSPAALIECSDGGIQIVEVGFHEAELARHLARTSSPLERTPFAVDAVRVAVAPRWEIAPQSFHGDDMLDLCSEVSFFIWVSLKRACLFENTTMLECTIAVESSGV